MPVSTYRVRALVENVRKRWRTRAVLQGISLALLTALFFAALFMLLYFQTELRIDYLLIGLGISAIAVLYVAVKYAAMPFFKKLDDRQIALYIEEKIPGLEDRLNSAVELGNMRPLEDTIISNLVDDASRQITAIPLTTVVDQKRQRILSLVAAGLFVLFLVFSYNKSDDILSVFSGANVSMAATPEKPYMSVSPGNIEIEKGESQEIITYLRDASEAEVMLHYKIGAGEWLKESMRKGVGEPAYLYQFVNVQEPFQYFIVHEQVQSETFNVTLYEFPAVGQIDLRYTYPDYTGVPARTEQNTGDIRGLKGSSVGLTISTTGTVQTAEMVFESGRRVQMNDVGNGQYRAQMDLSEDDYYHVELLDAAGKANKFPVEYQIVVEEDQKPIVSITEPQRDVRVNAIEEVLIAASASDDYGVKDLRLHISINGEDEQVHPLIQSGKRGMLEAEGDYVVFLEDFTLEPGDVISYYVETEDYFESHGTEATDMYFIEVVPFDQTYTQENNMGGGGGGGGMQSRTVISQQEIIAATWRLHRQRDQETEESLAEGAEGLERAQANLMNDIEERISETTFTVELRSDPEVQKVAELLREAVNAMKEAIEELDDVKLEEALKPERKALNYLLRADALNRERNVTRNNNQQGGGGGGNMEDRMTELMDLELDISRDKYEIQEQRQSAAQQQQEMDETLDRIKELARRQQRMANQNRQEQMEGEDKKRYIERLKRDQDELREQTENLAQNLRNQQQPQQSQSGQAGKQVQEGLQRAIEHMRDAERALRNNDEQRAAASQQQALNELDKLQQELRVAGAETTREMLDELSRDFDDLNKQEDQLAEDIRKVMNEATQNNGRVGVDELDRLEENRKNLRAKFDQFESQAEAVEKSTRSEDPEVASGIRNMLQRMRRDEMEKKLEDSEKALANRWLDYAERLEEEIQTGFERMETQMRELENTMPQTDEEQLRRALSDLQNLRNRIEQMEEQATRGQESSQSSQQSSSQQSSSQESSQQQSGQAAGGQGGDRQAREAAARMQRQLEQAREAMERLENQLDGNQSFQRSLQQAGQAMRRLTDASNTGVLLDEESAEDYFDESIYKPFSELELDLARALDKIEMEKKLYGARRTQVPEEYQDVVDKYYESLSKNN